MTKRNLLLPLAALAASATLVLSACSTPATPAASSSATGATQTDQTQTTTDSAQGQAAQPQPSTTAKPASPGKTADVTKLVVKDVKVGTGTEAKAGDTVSVNYAGWLTDGKEFDSSYGKQPFSFTIGEGRVIPGWEQGVAGMKVGGVRMLTIPASLGYGSQGAGGVIPPNATLVFQVELLGVQGK